MVEWVITMSIQTRITWEKSQDVIIVWSKDESVNEAEACILWLLALNVDFLMSFNATIKCLFI